MKGDHLIIPAINFYTNVRKMKNDIQHNDKYTL